MKVTDLLWIILAGAGALYAYDKYKSISTESDTPASAVPHVVTGQEVEDRSWIKPRDNASAVTQTTSQVGCDGRTHCSQMRSCAEAEFFIRNCPNTKMDGDGDGRPCEQQWCN